MSALTETIISAYEMTPADIALLEAILFEQLRLAYLERIRGLAVQHGVPHPTVMLAWEQEQELRQKAREDAQSIADTFNADLQRQVEAIYERNPAGDRAYFVGTLASWGRSRDEGKSVQIAMYTILWAANYGFDLFITRNNIQYQLYRAVGGMPICDDCIFIYAAGVVNYKFTQEYPLPLHIGCSHEWSTVNATDLTERGGIVWLGI